MTEKQIDRFFPPRSDFFQIPSESEQVLKQLYTANKLRKQNFLFGSHNHSRNILLLFYFH